MFTRYKRIPCSLAMVLLLAAIPEQDHLSAFPPQGPEVVGGQPISCSPETPVVEIGSAVRLRAFVSSPAQQGLQYSWTATAGKIQGSDDRPIWRLNGVLSGRYQAKVVVSRGGRKLGECSLQLIVLETQRSSVPSRESARSFLIKDQDEESGYGLYSYLLFGSPPTEANRKRYLKAIEAYIKLLLPLKDLQDNVAHGKLNVTYFLTKTVPPSSPTSEWLLANYDFARARILLDLLPGNHRQGPYLISALAPLSTGSSLPKQYLFQDLSQVPTEPNDLLSWWVLEFENQAAQEQFWEPPTGEHLALRLRTTISVLAAGLPEVEEQLHSWIVWAKGA